MLENNDLCNILVERELLGALLTDNTFEVEISEIIKPEYFAFKIHGEIYELIIQTIRQGKLASPATMKAEANQLPEMKDGEGLKYLQELYLNYGVAHIKVSKHHAEIIKGLWQKRQIISINRTTIDRLISDVHTEANDILDDQQQRLFELCQVSSHRQKLIHISQVVDESIQTIKSAYKHQGMVGLKTEIQSIDSLLGGMHNGNLIIIAGRPAMGKTALVTSITYNVAKKYKDNNGKDGAVVGFFSLEMSKDELIHRFIARESGIAAYKLRQGDITDSQFMHKILPAVAQIKELPIYVDDSAAATIDNIRSRARYFTRVHNLGLIIVDYLQLIRIQDNRRYQNRVVEISEITQGLKNLAKDLNIPVIALSQLSRNVEHREEKRPQLSDLRESGSIEQDADVVGFVYREEYYIKQRQPAEDSENFADWQEKMAEVHNKAEFIVNKQRHGPTGKAMLCFDPMITAFYDLE